jgi:hypothetical protein
VLHHDGNGNVWWKPVACTVHQKLEDPHRRPLMSDQMWKQISSRAYAATCLLFDRFLLVVGGMKESGSILQPILLDTVTWTWYYERITGDDIDQEGWGVVPSPRHGASIVVDTQQRNRLVLFGGGSGSDLLRSGQDNAEVWELNLNDCQSADEVLTSFPWTWKRVHCYSDPHNHPDHHNGIDQPSIPNVLSPSEKLNLGRCHASFRVSRDSVLLAFGGRPTCNSILGYRLDTDTFFRPVVRGPLPQARFSFASLALADMGYVVFHGGFCSHNTADTIDGMCMLDLAAGMQRPFEILPEVDAEQVGFFPMVSNEEAELTADQGRRRSNADQFVSLVSQARNVCSRTMHC